jgi:hypothetical protein
VIALGLALTLLATAPAPTGAPPQAAPAPAAPAAAPRTEARGVTASAQVDREHAGLGEPFTLVIEATHAPADTVSLPDPLPLGDLALRGKPVAQRQVDPKTGRAVTRFAVPLTNVKTLKPRVPELVLHVDGPEGPRQAMTRAIALQLDSQMQPDGSQGKEKGPRPPKQPVPILIKSWLWAGVLAAAIALGALLWLAARLGRKAKAARAIANQPKPLTPDEEALQRIMALKARAPWKRGLGRAAIFELSEIMRVYLGKRLGFDAIDLTSDELLSALKKRRILGLDLAGLTEELQWEDLVKFAKLEPTNEECEEAIVRAAELVERMRPLPAVLPPLSKPPPAKEARS